MISDGGGVVVIIGRNMAPKPVSLMIFRLGSPLKANPGLGIASITTPSLITISTLSVGIAPSMS